MLPSLWDGYTCACMCVSSGRFIVDTFVVQARKTRKKKIYAQYSKELRKKTLHYVQEKKTQVEKLLFKW